MAVYQILNDDHEVLRMTAKPIPRINDGVIRLLDNLKDTLTETQKGVGIAAPQIGISKRAFIIDFVDIDEEEVEEHYSYEMINPVISEMSGLEEAWEGCLSIFGVEGLIPRAYKLKVAYTDREGVERELEAEGYLARIIQHEYDHLDGVLFVDRATEYRDITQKTEGEEDLPAQEEEDG